MHVIAIGGILAFNWFGKEDKPVTGAEAAGLVESPHGPGGATQNTASRGPVVVDHPDPEFQAKGYKRYRVGLNEQLPHIARMFNASVAKLEQINGFKSGEKLYFGQWILVVDQRGVSPEASQEVADIDPEPDSTPIDPVEETPPSPAPEPESFDEVVADRPVHERLTEIPAGQPALEPEPEPAPAPIFEPQPQPQPSPEIYQPAPAPAPTPPVDPRFAPAPFPQPNYQPQPQPPYPQPQPAPQQPPIQATPIPQPNYQPQPQPQPQTQPQPNLPGPASPIWRQGTQTPPQTAVQPPRALRTYRVVTGDTAYGIARRFGVTVQQLLQANNLSSPELKVGQLLRVP